ncbi:MAG TPA: adenylate/guanylate cyclase domain-containing protein [Phnomibacter sp.]|nr:adenylate/guanylate cyclase domain-containing protein [Phnomibacter sp.]
MGFARTLVSCCALLIVSMLAAQNAAIDSLKQVIAKAAADSNKVNSLLALSKEYLSNDPAKAIQYANEANVLASTIGYTKGNAYSYKALGLVYLMQGRYIETIENFESALAVFDSLGDKKGQANMLSNEGTVYFNQADDAKALELYLKALHIAEQTDDSTRIATLLLNIGAVYAHKKATYDKALDYYRRALEISRLLPDKNIIGTVNANIGEIYLLREEIDMALPYFKESLKDYAGSENTPYALNNLGKAYFKKGNYQKAIEYHEQALEFARKLEAPVDEADALLGIGDTYMEMQQIDEAIASYKKAETISQSISHANDQMKYTYIGLALAYAQKQDFSNAYRYQTLYSSVKDSLYNIDTDKKLSGLQFNFDIQKKQAQVDLLTKDKIVKDLQLKRQNVAKNILIGGLVIAFVFASVLYRNYRNKIKVNKILDRQNAEIESLILNILPKEVAMELQKTGHATPKYYEKATVLFTDFKGFSKLADEMSPQEVVTELGSCFVAFDEIIERYNLEKIKTIGDSYMCAGGIPTEDEDHPINIVKASLEMQSFIAERNERRAEMNLPPWVIRVGINTGPVVAGVVGRKKYAYDIWGGTVNIASRLESNGEPGQVNISASTYELIKDVYPCTYRGKIYAKNIGEIDMYFVNA